MRAISLIRAALIVMVCGSIGVAGTAVVWSTGERVINSVISATEATPEQALQPVQAGQLEKQLRNYRVRLTPDGKLEGRLNVIDPATGEPAPARSMVLHLMQRGQKVAEFHTGIGGMFEVQNVLPGVYSLIGHGEEGIIAYGLEIMPPEFQVDAGKSDHISPVAFQEIESELQIDSLAVPPGDGPSVLDLANQYLPEDIVNRARQRAESNSGPPAEAAPAAPAEPREDLDPAQEDPADEAIPAANLRQYAIRLGADGSLTGRMRSLNPQSGQPARFHRLNVFLVKDNEVVGQAPVDPAGTFTFPDLLPGYYSFIAAGTDGFTAFSIRTVTEAVAGVETFDELAVPVSFVQLNMGQLEALLKLFGFVVPPEDMEELLYWLNYYYANPPQDDDDGGAAAPFGGAGGPGGAPFGGPPGGGFGGGGGGLSGGGGGFAGGGGGIGGGLGGLGALLAAAALGVGAWALADSNDDDRNVIRPPIISPSQFQ